MLAVAGLVLVPVMLALAALRRIARGAQLRDEDAAIFVYSQVTWDEVWQRPQQYAWLSAEQHPVIYCCPVQMHNLLYLGRSWRPVRSFADGGRRLLVLSPLVFSGHFKNRMVHEINCWITAAHVQLAFRGGLELRVMANTPFALRVLERLARRYGRTHKRGGFQIRRLVFDVIDDFTVFDWSPEFGKEFDRKLTAGADAVIAGTHELAAARPAVPFIPCGVDFDLFHTPQPEPLELRDLPRPLIGYFGTISERIDLSMIDRLAREFPSASVVMVGPVHFPAHALPRRENLHFLGLRRHAELPAFAQAFNVGLIPFRITEATTRLNPVKTLEYLAAGLPVVATALPDLVRFYTDVISIAHSEDEFVEAVRAALHSPEQERIARGIDRARSASWQAMVDDMNAVLFSEGPQPASVQLTEDSATQPPLPHSPAGVRG
jgi:glycosyltransferase involved in cell wall biosynthesis